MESISRGKIPIAVNNAQWKFDIISKNMICVISTMNMCVGWSFVMMSACGACASF